jgi:hypothetical protein
MLVVTRPVKSFLAFMEPEVSLPCSQEPSTGSYPEPDEFSLHCGILFILIMSSHQRLHLRRGLFPFRVFDINFKAFLISLACYVSQPSHLPRPVTASKSKSKINSERSDLHHATISRLLTEAVSHFRRSQARHVDIPDGKTHKVRSF